MTTSSLPKRILTLGMPSDYPPEFREISAACDFAISIAPDGQIAVTKDRQGVVPRPPTIKELLSVEPVMPGDVARILGGGNGNGQRPAPRFDHDDLVTPGPDSTLGFDVGAVGKVLARAWCENCAGWHYLVQFENSVAQMLEARMRPAEEVEAADQDASPRDGSADYASGWQGTPPAEGTRRATILEAIRSCPDGAPMSTLELADRIESALLRATIEEEADELPGEVRGVVEEALTDDVEDTHGFSGEFDVMVGPNGAYVSIDSVVQILSQLGDEAEEEYERSRPEPGEVVPVEAEPTLFDLFRSLIPRRG